MLHGLITTPAAYYSTAKGKYLAEKYKENLERLVERIVRNPTTSKLQFANNIASVGGIGFFTHSATKSPDERYLEVILAVPEIFDTKGEYSTKVFRLFSQYGPELLSLMSSDAEISQEKELSGYGLSFSWRNTVPTPNGSRVTLDRAIIYFPKDKVKGYLKQEVAQNNLLGDAVIFAVEEEGPAKLVSYSPQVLKPDFRPPVQEETLGITSRASGSVTNLSKPPEPAVTELPKTQATTVREASEQSVLKESTLRSPAARRQQDGKSAPVTASNPRGQESALLPPVRSIVNTAKPDRPQEKSPDKPPISGENATASEARHRQPQDPKIESELAEGKSQADIIGTPASPPSGASARPQNAPLRAVKEQADTNKALANPEEKPKGRPRSPVAPASERVSEIRTHEQTAVLTKAGAVPGENKSTAPRPISKPLEGYIIQLSFPFKNEAQRWAGLLEKRGFSLSMTEAGADQTVRVRIGNFAVREEADRVLRKLRQEGLTGIVLNLPESFRPEVGRATADGTISSSQ
ncbi:MAG TPA: SPOR domain-containing protein [Candidatus Binatia bacterium]|nr:SPOR domain-containing protein [Candidatus Binatia bacterium]